MKVIGITGGVGSGKTALLNYLSQRYNCRVLLADEAANRLKEPGQPCFEPLVCLLGNRVLDGEGRIDKGKMAERIFADQGLLLKVNEIIHPAVKRYILGEIDRERKENRVSFFFLEAALLIEEGYLHIVDEMWYIYAEKEVRKKRLRETRGYSDEKIESIIKTQLEEEKFREVCGVVIDNSNSLEEACRQMDRYLEGKSDGRKL